MKTIKLLINTFIIGCIVHYQLKIRPVNDDLCDAEQLFMNDPPTSGTTVDATDELFEINPDCFTGN